MYCVCLSVIIVQLAIFCQAAFSAVNNESIFIAYLIFVNVTYKSFIIGVQSQWATHPTPQMPWGSVSSPHDLNDYSVSLCAEALGGYLKQSSNNLGVKTLGVGAELHSGGSLWAGFGISAWLCGFVHFRLRWGFFLGSWYLM